MVTLCPDLVAEILSRIEPKVQAVISRRNKAIADERKYESIQYTITPEELDDLNIRTVYVRVGSRENHIFTCWNMLGHVEPYGTDATGYSLRVVDGSISERNEEFYAGVGGPVLLSKFQSSCEYLTKLAYKDAMINGEQFDYIVPFDQHLEFELIGFYHKDDVYEIYLRRCRNIGLDSTYADRIISNYCRKLLEYVSAEELNFELKQ